MTEKYDTIIIGGGPAGLTAGIYAMRSRLDTVLIEKYACGGQMNITEFVENFPGFASGIGGFDLSAAMESQVRSLGLSVFTSEVLSVDFSHPEKIVNTADGQLRAATVIISTGATPRRLDIPGERDLLGKGVSYCATCDGAFFRDKEIAVVGGGNTAIQDAAFLSKFASKVTIIHRRDALRATKILQERVFKNPKIEVLWNSTVSEIEGSPLVQSVMVQDVINGKLQRMPVAGVFILIGTVPHTHFLKGAVTLDPEGYVITDEDMKTSIPGVYAAGDCRRKSLRQMVTAASDGAIAAISAERYIESLKDRKS